MEYSAGFVIIQDNKILLGHPTNQPWFNSYSFPKGRMEEGEDFLETALRETKEEIGIDIKKYVVEWGDEGFIEYSTRGVVHKKIYYQVLYCNGINKDTLNLQKAEMDWAGFITKEEAEKRIFWRLKEVLNYLD
jgi:ADP-ribose pyrophosphatase YjhB (NUDIX family)